MEPSITQTLQISIADAVYAAAVREALSRSGPWHMESVDTPDPAQKCVLVLDENAFHRLPLPLPNPERVVLIARKAPELMAHAWEAGIVSVVSDEDPLNTVLLAIMAAALRLAKQQVVARASGISPRPLPEVAPIAPQSHPSFPKRCKSQ